MKRISTILLIIIALESPGQNITRKAVFQKGEQFVKTVSTQSSMTIKYMGIEKKATNSFSNYAQVHIKQVTDTGYVLENTVKRIVYDSDAMGVADHFDSDSAHDNSPSAGQFREQVGKAKLYLLNRDGRIVFTEDTVSLSDEAKAVAGSSENAINFIRRPGQTYEMIAPLPAGRKLMVSDEWTDSFYVEGYKVIATYRVIAVNKKEATISQIGPVSTVLELNNAGIKTVIRTTGTCTGSFIMDIKTGIITGCNSVIETSGSMEIGKMSIPVSMKIESNSGMKPVKG